MDLNIKIQNIKCIKNLEISFPLELKVAYMQLPVRTDQERAL